MSFSPPAPADVTLAVLAGGEGRRMGMPKGLLQIAGRPILEYLLDQFDWPGPTALITAPSREHPPGWQKFDSEWVDPVAGLGPLRGVLTALENAGTEWVAVVTVDMPGIKPEVIRTVLDSLSQDDQGRMYRHPPGNEGGLIEPFPLVIRSHSASVVRQRIETGRLSVIGLLEEPGFDAQAIPANWNKQLWINLNRPADLA